MRREHSMQRATEGYGIPHKSLRQAPGRRLGGAARSQRIQPIRIRRTPQEAEFVPYAHWVKPAAQATREFAREQAAKRQAEPQGLPFAVVSQERS